MAVAKSYENMTVVGEPFEFNDKMWVKVIGPCKRCGGSGHYSMNAMGDTTCYRCGGSGKETMEVRWYTDARRAALDRAAEKRRSAAAVQHEIRRKQFAARNAFGFGEEGFITLLSGNNDEIKAWRDTLPQHTIFWNTIFGWYIPSTNEVEIPSNIKATRLEWEAIKEPTDNESLTMKDNAVVKDYVEKLLYSVVDSKSEYQGEKNDWIERDVTVMQNYTSETRYGINHMHIMQDADENVYVWGTASKNLEIGTQCHMKMKVKDHQEYKGIKQTVVYYCKIK